MCICAHRYVRMGVCCIINTDPNKLFIETVAYVMHVQQMERKGKRTENP